MHSISSGSGNAQSGNAMIDQSCHLTCTTLDASLILLAIEYGTHDWIILLYFSRASFWSRTSRGTDKRIQAHPLRLMCLMASRCMKMISPLQLFLSKFDMLDYRLCNRAFAACSPYYYYIRRYVGAGPCNAAPEVTHGGGPEQYRQLYFLAMQFAKGMLLVCNSIASTNPTVSFLLFSYTARMCIASLIASPANQYDKIGGPMSLEYSIHLRHLVFE